MQTPLPDATSLGVKTDENDTDAEGRSLNTSGKGKSPLHIALESVLGVMRGKILSGPSDFIGVLIYNIDVSPRKTRSISLILLNPPGPQRYGGEASRTETNGTGLDIQQHGMTLYLPLRQIGADEIKGLNQFMEGRWTLNPDARIVESDESSVVQTQMPVWLARMHQKKDVTNRR